MLYCLCFVCVLVTLGQDCVAEPKSHPLEGFHHSAWGAESGLGAVYDLRQAPDGFLWLTTSNGIFRFDGVTFESVDSVTGGAVSNADLDAVFVTKNGDLWLTTRAFGLLRWSGGKLTTYPDRRCTSSEKTDGMVEASDGSLWIRTRSGIAHLSASGCQEMGRSDGYPGGWARGFVVDHRGTLWVRVDSGIVVSLSEGSDKFKPVLKADPTVAGLSLREGPDSEIWSCQGNGVHPIHLEGSSWSRSHGTDSFGDFAFSREGALWVGNSIGVTRYEGSDVKRLEAGEKPLQSRTFSVADGLTSTAIWKILLDREGGIWIASTRGLDYLRPAPLHSLSLQSGDMQVGIAAGRDGKMFVGGRTLPLIEVNEEAELARNPSINQLTMLRADRDGILWASGAGELWKLQGGQQTRIHYPNESTNGVAAAALDRKGDLWLLLIGGITLRLHDGRWERQDTELQRRDGVVGTMAADRDGNIWLAYSNRLTRWDGEKFSLYAFQSRSTLMRLSVYTLYPTSGRVWMGGGGGILVFENGQFHPFFFEDQRRPGRVTGIVETANGDLWINGFSGVTHVRSGEIARWESDHNYHVAAETLNDLDGLPGLASDRMPEPSVIQASDGKIWFATSRSVAWLDPNERERRNLVAPAPQITSVMANGASLPVHEVARLGPRLESLHIAFTAPSLLVPERVNFQYKLENLEKGWQNAGTRREASFNNLKPGRYTFLVRASNNDGIWSQTPAIFSFVVRPAWFQTAWFFAACGVFLALALWWFILLRSRSLVEKESMRLEERANERVRIARELHDTLLQSLFGLLMQFQSVKRKLPLDEAAQDELDRVLERAEAVMRDGRDRVRSLRGASAEQDGLASPLRTLGSQYEALTRIPFDLEVVGECHGMKPLIREEVVLIAREAITNAFRHANANSVRVELDYATGGLRLSVIDDGQGIDDDILAKGYREDHWGLIGMRERAERMGAKFSISLRKSGGTRIDLKVSGKIAFEKKAGSRDGAQVC